MYFPSEDSNHHEYRFFRRASYRFFRRASPRLQSLDRIPSFGIFLNEVFEKKVQRAVGGRKTHIHRAIFRSTFFFSSSQQYYNRSAHFGRWSASVKRRTKTGGAGEERYVNNNPFRGGLYRTSTLRCEMMLVVGPIRHRTRSFPKLPPQDIIISKHQLRGSVRHNHHHHHGVHPHGVLVHGHDAAGNDRRCQDGVG